MPDVHIPNLASRILGQNLRRLSADWVAVYGHPILIAETFVDTGRFRGTCYKAAGFLPLGETRGFRRNGGKRGHWGIENKLHYVRDVTYDEDRCRIRTKSGPRVMAALRNLAIGIFQLRKHTNITQAVRLYGAKQHLTLGLIGI